MRSTFRRGGIATAACLALTTAGTLAGPPAAHARAGAPAASALQADFASAAREFQVPLPVLLAVSYLESRWDGHRGGYNTGGGYGLMNLTDVTPSMFAAGGAGTAGRADATRLTAAPAMHTLTAAARLTGIDAARLRDDDAANIRGGAALLAAYQRKAGAGAAADPAAWWQAVARYSQSPAQEDAGRFADEVYGVIAAGARVTTADGQVVSLTARPWLRPRRVPVPGLRVPRAAGPPTECPAGTRCSFLPSAAGSYQSADRPSDGVRVQYIVIHDTESSYGSAVSAFQDPADGTAAHYVMRSSDGAVTQMVPDRDIAFHAGNYWFNMHSVGIEHEGFAARGATWYTEAQYRATGRLVTYLARRYGVRLDRQHIIGHDNVPGPASGYVAGMHWDPGPYWDWSHFMRLIGAGVPKHGSAMPRTGTAVTIAPDFATNRQTVEVCGEPTGDPRPRDDGAYGDEPEDDAPVCTRQTRPSDFLFVRTAPSARAPLFADPALHPGGSPGSDRINDWGDTVVAGQQFVVAGRSGDWTAIWFSGSKVWFHNPRGVNTAAARDVGIVTPAASAAPAAVYGQGYPRPFEYPDDARPSAQAPLSMYAVPAGQAYVSTAPAVPADDYFPTSPPDTYVTGSARYRTVQYDHRLALLDASDLTVRGSGRTSRDR